MDEIALEEQWNELVSSRYGALENRIAELLTVNDVVREGLYGDLRWAISRTEFEELVTGDVWWYILHCAECFQY